MISEYVEIRVPWHREQLHLAEFVALRAREILFNLDLSIDAKNMAAQKAARHRGLVTEAEADDPTPRVEQFDGDGEDVEGIVPDDEHVEMDGEESEGPRVGETCKQVQQSMLLDIVTRRAEIAEANAAGQTRDMYKVMKQVHDIFEDHLDDMKQVHDICEGHRHLGGMEQMQVETTSHEPALAAEHRLGPRRDCRGKPWPRPPWATPQKRPPGARCPQVENAVGRSRQAQKRDT